MCRGEPTGSIIQIDNKINGYLAKPLSGQTNKAILYLPDIFGIWQNSKLMADAFAAEGYICLVLDTFNGDPVPLQMPDGFAITKWLNEGSDGKNPHTTQAVDPIVVSGINYLKNIGVEQIAAVGYCLGAKVRFIDCCQPFSSRTKNISAFNSTLQKWHRRGIHRPSVLCRARRAGLRHRTSFHRCSRAR